MFGIAKETIFRVIEETGDRQRNRRLEVSLRFKL